MQKLFKIFVKRFLNLFLILIFSQSAVALEVYFKSASKSLDVEVANSDAKRRQGLMHRQDLAKNHGMLFLHQKNSGLPSGADEYLFRSNERYKKSKDDFYNRL